MRSRTRHPSGKYMRGRIKGQEPILESIRTSRGQRPDMGALGKHAR